MIAIRGLPGKRQLYRGKQSSTGGLHSCQGRATPLGRREFSSPPGMSDIFRFDVLLSHSSKDKPVVRDIAERLKKDGVKAWFDEWVSSNAGFETGEVIS